VPIAEDRHMRYLHLAALCLVLLLFPLVPAPRGADATPLAETRGADATPLADDVCHTFSIVAYDPDKQEWGVGVASKVLAVGAVVPFAKAGVGAIATQSAANITYGPNGLKLLAEG